ncbi:hypothetical protein [Amycolatopsis sp. YIM 10]|uniref:hypothetical protein n=1 Tax=Amycolatopsis sp. YIM 10 TaxID=2653857 RepID=UPI00128FDAF1|nr:hypothetical protein [Amycolatopsis sp. YIM 10]QFU90266.1 hypothetical protein YIM_25450 [Amycolatopsis sp. YIM 10]
MTPNAIVYFLIAATLFLVLRLTRHLILTGGIRLPNRAAPPPAAGSPATPFTARLVDGRVFNSRDHADDGYLLLFISEHCDSCRKLMPKLPALGRLIGDAGRRLLLVSFEEDIRTGESLNRLLAENGVHERLAVVSASHPLRRDFNPAETTPFFCAVADGAVTATGLVGSPAWTRLFESLVPASAARH